MFLPEKTPACSPFRENYSPPVIKLSAAIRIGCPWVVETDVFSGCAIGTGYRAITGRDLTDDWLNDHKPGGSKREATKVVADAFSVPEDLVEHISAQHYLGKWSREECADWLEAQGY